MWRAATLWGQCRPIGSAVGPGPWDIRCYCGWRRRRPRGEDWGAALPPTSFFILVRCSPKISNFPRSSRIRALLAERSLCESFLFASPFRSEVDYNPRRGSHLRALGFGVQRAGTRRVRTSSSSNTSSPTVPHSGLFAQRIGPAVGCRRRVCRRLLALRDARDRGGSGREVFSSCSERERSTLRRNAVVHHPPSPRPSSTASPP